MLTALMILAFQQPPPMLLRLDPPVGTTVRYRTTMRGAQLSWDSYAVHTVIARSDTTTVVEVRTAAGSLELMSESAQVPASIDTFVISRRGGLLSSSRRDSPPPGFEHLAPVLPAPALFPEYPVRTGESWQRGELVDSLVSIERDSAGRLVATIRTPLRSDSIEPLLGTPVSSRGYLVSRYDLTRGLLLSARSVIESTGTAVGESTTQQMEQIIEIVP
jgi:hypothetical protein